ncbi:collagen-like protein [Gluconobacter sp. Dm-73]|uniref:collagen-like triple helix repeat-containing protein n=1 Tax=Gluconobacter sp. Dm-73 TaxID=2799802 RepID=UPI001B8C27FD|nr:collagen-like protein [Gluconobacter sp. Dm-73]MBS1075283.1 collagen-like protein [Gluconobacter sp. Dm-73]
MTTVHNLTPSPLRTVTLQSCTGLYAQVMWTPKASADCLDYVLDFSTLLAGTGDTLTAIRSAVVTTATGGDYDLKIMWSAVAGTLVVAFLASGQPNTAQKILFEITIQQGRVYSVMAVLQITALTAATAPSGSADFPVDTLTNGKVLIAGIEALPSGYSANGRVVVATEDAAPVGTPSFESVTSESYGGDGSGLNVTTTTKTQTIAEWIAALSSSGAQGVGIKAINVTQGTVTAGQPSTVTLTATLTDGTTTAPATFEAPAGAVGATGAQGAQGVAGPSGAKGNDGATGSAGPQGVKGDTSATGADGAAGQTGAAGSQGVGIASVAVSQGAVTAGQASTVTLTATMTNGATAPGVSFEAPAGAPGSSGGSTDLTAAAINAALGYTAADASKFLALSPDAAADLQTITAPSDSKFGASYSFGVTDNYGNALKIGCISQSGTNWFGIYSPSGHSTGLLLADFLGNSATIAGHGSSDGTQDLYSGWLAGNCEGSEGGFRLINKDSRNTFWKFSCPANDTANQPWSIYAADTAATGWQTPLVSFNPVTNTAEFLNEPVVATAYTFATLPASPVAWQRALVTDKAIGSGTQGVMTMWNPNTKAWTGLGGEPLV